MQCWIRNYRFLEFSASSSKQVSKFRMNDTQLIGVFMTWHKVLTVFSSVFKLGSICTCSDLFCCWMLWVGVVVHIPFRFQIRGYFFCGHATCCSFTFAIGNFKRHSEEAGSGLVFCFGHFISNFTSVSYTTFSPWPFSSKAGGSFWQLSGFP